MEIYKQDHSQLTTLHSTLTLIIMKKLFYATTTLAIIMLLSCKDDEVTINSENPLKNYLVAAGFTEVESLINDEAYEFGITFIPKVNGEINSIVVKLPDDQTDLRVTIWESEDKTVLQTIIIPAVKADTEIIHSIPAFSVTKDTQYMITFNTDDYYNRTQPDGGDAIYPIAVGNISVTGYGYSQGSNQTYPYSFQTYYYAGDLSFVFTPKN